MLTLLKYAGLLLATVASIWGAVTQTTAKGPKGKTIISRAGWVTIGFIVVGMLIAIATNILEDIENDKLGKLREWRESERAHQIIAASQPLRTLTLRWEFGGVPTSL